MQILRSCRPALAWALLATLPRTSLADQEEVSPGEYERWKTELPDGYLEVHTFSVDSDGNLYGGDNQYERTRKFVPKPDADPALLIGTPWVDESAVR